MVGACVRDRLPGSVVIEKVKIVCFSAARFQILVKRSGRDAQRGMGSGLFGGSTHTSVAYGATVFFEWESFCFRMFFLEMLQIQVAGNATVNATAVLQQNLSDPILGAVEVA
jgi:hypothetical protein